MLDRGYDPDPIQSILFLSLTDIRKFNLKYWLSKNTIFNAYVFPS